MDFLCDYESNNSLFILHPILVLIYAVLERCCWYFSCFLPHSALLKMSKTQKELSSALTRKFSIRLTKSSS